MGRQASVTIEHVKTAVAALRAEGKTASSRNVREKLGTGSMGTISKLLQQCLDDKEGTPDSLRQLPPELQRVILAFADQQAEAARTQIGEELISCKLEVAGLAEDNERLTTIIEDLRMQLAQALSGRAAAEGRVEQVLGELAGAREETKVERHAAEAARVEMAKLQLRLDALGPLDVELRDARAQSEERREECARVLQAAAVLEAQKLALFDQVQELKGDLANARATSAKLDEKIQALSALLDNEREEKAVAERELAVAKVLTGGAPNIERRGRKHRGQQGTLWQGEPVES